MKETETVILNGERRTISAEGVMIDDYFQLDYFQSDYFQTGVLLTTATAGMQTADLNPVRRTLQLLD
jgi:hypothetical protein